MRLGISLTTYSWRDRPFADGLLQAAGTLVMNVVLRPQQSEPDQHRSRRAS